MRARSANVVRITTAARGAVAPMRWVASTPSTPGISMSMSTTSGSSVAGQRHAGVAVAGGADHLDVGHRAQQVGDAAPDDGMVVDDEHADHRRRSSDRHLEDERGPGAGRALDRELAAGVDGEVGEQREPEVACRRRAGARPGRSRRRRRGRAAGPGRCRCATAMSTWVAVVWSMVLRTASCAPRNSSASPARSSASGDADVDAGLDAPGAHGGREVLERGGEALVVQALRRDRDDERPEVADPLAQVGGARVEVAGELARRRARARRARARRGSSDEPARSCTTESWRSAAIRRRSRSDDSIARTSSSRSRSRERRSRRSSASASGSCTSQSSSSPPTSAGANAMSIRLPFAVIVS